MAQLVPNFPPLATVQRPQQQLNIRLTLRLKLQPWLFLTSNLPSQMSDFFFVRHSDTTQQCQPDGPPMLVK
jgi:hypothetical protein